MDHFMVIIVIIGAAILGMAWMPAITDKIRISYSVIYLAVGVLLYSLIDFLPSPLPSQHPDETLHLTEMVVIVSLMGTGLKIDQQFNFRTWHVPFRLVSVTMLLCIAGMMAVCIYLLDFNPVVALLVAAVLAPTDPVLATDVQVGAPHEDERDNVKFSLTAEAGFNDGVAFPFVWLAIIWAGFSQGANPGDVPGTIAGSITDWFLWHVLYQFGIAILSGVLLGKLVAFLIFGLPRQNNSLTTRDGFVSIAATLLVYGATELIHGYGFVAVFIAGLAIRDYERSHKFHKRLHEFSDQVERIMVAIMLILFGGALVEGILDALSWRMAFAGLTFVFIIRPLSAFLSLYGSGLQRKEKLIISFFGIRGAGSVFYLAFAFSVAEFGKQDELWALIAFIILISIVIHGSTAAFFLKKLDKDVEVIAE